MQALPAGFHPYLIDIVHPASILRETVVPQDMAIRRCVLQLREVWQLMQDKFSTSSAQAALVPSTSNRIKRK
jgi:hypothetical protein